MLIVNADDWGGFCAGTDAIESCFASGVISSATAMVHMADSARAARLGLERERPLGLHLNFTQPFDAADIDPHVRGRQLRLCAHFADLGRRRWQPTPDPRLHRLVRDGIRDQLGEFQARYRRMPTHIDSHQHVHVCPDVFLSRALEPGTRVRQTLSPVPRAGGSPSLRAMPSWVKHAVLAARFTTTARFWYARELRPGAGGSVPIAEAARWAARRPVEVVVHPSSSQELAVLQSEHWVQALRGARLGAYSELTPRHRATARAHPASTRDRRYTPSR